MPRALPLSIIAWIVASSATGQVPVDVTTEDAGPIVLVTPGSWPLHITVRNLNMDYAIDSLQAHWQLDGGPVHSCTVHEFLIWMDLLYPTFPDRFTHADPVVLPAAGTHVLKVWTSMPGGFPDTNTANDTLSTTITVVDSLPPKQVMMFYGTHVLCMPCGSYGEPSIEAVLDSLPGQVNMAAAFDFTPDPYEVPEGELFNEIYVWPYTGHPAFVFDVFQFPFFWDVTTHTWGELYRNPDRRLEYASPVEVTVEDLAFDNSTHVLSGEVRAKFWVAHEGSLAMNAIITEDSVYGPQSGAPGGYVFHRHILRGMPAGIAGAGGLVPTTVNAGEEFIYSFSDTLAPDVVPENLYATGVVHRDAADPLLREILNSGRTRLVDVVSGMRPSLMSDIAVFPNPASEELFVRAPAAGEYTLRDASGRTTGTGRLVPGANGIAVSTLAEGLYVLHTVTHGTPARAIRVMVAR